LKTTFCAFCAETEMARVLRVKAATGGLSTDKFDGRNCTIRTEPLTPDNHKVIVSIGRETSLPLGPFGNIGFDDMNNVLFCNELRTELSYEERISRTKPRDSHPQPLSHHLLDLGGGSILFTFFAKRVGASR
jgi:hypothetical protein